MVFSPSCRLQPELLDLYTVNLHRIEKDVQRCDRNYWYFTPANLEKLRNIMCRWLGRGGAGCICRGSERMGRVEPQPLQLAPCHQVLLQPTLTM